MKNSIGAIEGRPPGKLGLRFVPASGFVEEHLNQYLHAEHGGGNAAR